jgi:hypothetical protein
MRDLGRCYRALMKDQRLKVFRAALDALIESLDALVRVSRWTDTAEAPPEPLRVAVSKLNDRLGTADRLASGKFVGTPTDTNKVNALCATMKRLDLAYVAYRKRLGGKPEQIVEAAAALESDIAEASAAAALA